MLEIKIFLLRIETKFSLVTTSIPQFGILTFWYYWMVPKIKEILGK